VLAGAALFVFTLVSAMRTKFHHYVLPAVPPLAMLLGIWLDERIAESAKGRPQTPRSDRMLALGAHASWRSWDATSRRGAAFVTRRRGAPDATSSPTDTHGCGECDRMGAGLRRLRGVRCDGRARVDRARWRRGAVILSGGGRHIHRIRTGRLPRRAAPTAASAASWRRIIARAARSRRPH